MLSFKVKYAIQILFELDRASRIGTRVTTTWLRETCGFERSVLSATISELNRSRMIEKFNSDIRLRTDLDETTLYDLIIAIDGQVRLGSTCVIDGWGQPFFLKCANAIEINNRIANELTAQLRQISIRDMVTTKASHHSS